MAVDFERLKKVNELASTLKAQGIAPSMDDAIQMAEDMVRKTSLNPVVEKKANRVPTIHELADRQRKNAIPGETQIIGARSALDGGSTSIKDLIAEVKKESVTEIVGNEEKFSENEETAAQEVVEEVSEEIDSDVEVVDMDKPEEFTEPEVVTEVKESPSDEIEKIEKSELIESSEEEPLIKEYDSVEDPDAVTIEDDSSIADPHVQPKADSFIEIQAENHDYEFEEAKEPEPNHDLDDYKEVKVNETTIKQEAEPESFTEQESEESVALESEESAEPESEPEETIESKDSAEPIAVESNDPIVEQPEETTLVNETEIIDVPEDTTVKDNNFDSWDDEETNTKEPTAEELIKPEHQDSDSAQDILDNSDKDLLKDSGEDLIQDSDDKVELETYDEDWDNTNKYHKD